MSRRFRVRHRDCQPASAAGLPGRAERAALPLASCPVATLRVRRRALPRPGWRRRPLARPPTRRTPRGPPAVDACQRPLSPLLESMPISLRAAHSVAARPAHWGSPKPGLLLAQRARASTRFPNAAGIDRRMYRDGPAPGGRPAQAPRDSDRSVSRARLTGHVDCGLAGLRVWTLAQPAQRLVRHEHLHLERGTPAGLGKQLRPQLSHNRLHVTWHTAFNARRSGRGQELCPQLPTAICDSELMLHATWIGQQVAAKAGPAAGSTCSTTLSCSAMCCVHARCIVSAELTISCMARCYKTQGVAILDVMLQIANVLPVNRLHALVLSWSQREGRRSEQVSAPTPRGGE
jgi:hypothetical protein